MRRGIIAQMKYRKLRIAWSAVCGILCLLLEVYWERSYRESETVFGVIGGQRIQLSSNCGRIQLFMNPKSMFTVPPKWKYMRSVLVPLPEGFEWIVARRLNAPMQGIELRGPHLLAVAFAGLLLTAPWLPWWSWQFSLRTLLIATTLVAVALGVVVWML